MSLDWHTLKDDARPRLDSGVSWGDRAFGEIFRAAVTHGCTLFARVADYYGEYTFTASECAAMLAEIEVLMPKVGGEVARVLAETRGLLERAAEEKGGVWVAGD